MAELARQPAPSRRPCPAAASATSDRSTPATSHPARAKLSAVAAKAHTLPRKSARSRRELRRGKNRRPVGEHRGYGRGSHGRTPLRGRVVRRRREQPGHRARPRHGTVRPAKRGASQACWVKLSEPGRDAIGPTVLLGWQPNGRLTSVSEATGGPGQPALSPPRAVTSPLARSEVGGAKAGAIILVGIATLNLANAAFHLLSARLLGPSQYGDVVSLVAAQGLIGLPLAGVQYAIARFVADDAARGDASGGRGVHQAGRHGNLASVGVIVALGLTAARSAHSATPSASRS